MTKRLNSLTRWKQLDHLFSSFVRSLHSSGIQLIWVGLNETGKRLEKLHNINLILNFDK